MWGSRPERGPGPGSTVEPELVLALALALALALEPELGSMVHPELQIRP